MTGVPDPTPETHQLYAASLAPSVGPPGAGLGLLPLAGGTLDRAATERRDPQLVERLLADPATRVAEVRGDRMHVAATPSGAMLTWRGPEAADPARLGLFLGRGAEAAAYLAVVVDEPAEAEAGWQTLRQAGLVLDDEEAAVFATALALANWHRVHGHCARCGAATDVVQGGWVRRCPDDSSEHYPRTDPAVIMAVVDPDDRLLLGRSPGWPDGRYSVLAGFVEPGESLEAAVAREVLEEVGVLVDEVTYLGNQPWPFPSSVMIGFTARARTTELRLDPDEMAEARWVTRDEFRTALRTQEIHASSGISIAQRLIERWLGQTIESART